MPMDVAAQNQVTASRQPVTVPKASAQLAISR